jgi:two-component system, OmpR family, sensor histidine kinase CiaH
MNTIYKQLEELVTNLKANNFRGAVLRLTAYYTVGVFCILLTFSFLVYGLFLFGTEHEFLEQEDARTETWEQRETEAFREIQDDLFDVLLFLDLVFLLVSIVVSYLLAQRTLAPLSASYQRQKRFVADAAHELRTPLSVIKAGSELLLQHERDSGQYKKFIGESLEEVNRLITLSNDLLFLAQSNESKRGLPTEFSLSEVCTQQVSLILPYAQKKNIAINTDIVQSVLMSGRMGDMARLVLNLLKNAIDYNTEGGSVTLSLTKNASEAVLIVRDTGIGIDAKDLTHIFDRFYKADSSRTQSEEMGSGLGLSMVYEILLDHQGTVTVESKRSEGTTFTLRFPLV